MKNNIYQQAKWDKTFLTKTFVVGHEILFAQLAVVTIIRDSVKRVDISVNCIGIILRKYPTFAKSKTTPQRYDRQIWNT